MKSAGITLSCLLLHSFPGYNTNSSLIEKFTSKSGDSLAWLRQRVGARLISNLIALGFVAICWFISLLTCRDAFRRSWPAGRSFLSADLPTQGRHCRRESHLQHRQTDRKRYRLVNNFAIDQWLLKIDRVHYLTPKSHGEIDWASSSLLKQSVCDRTAKATSLECTTFAMGYVSFWVRIDRLFSLAGKGAPLVAV